MQAGIISATREIVDVAKAAKLMGMPERTARHWAETGKIEAAVTASAWGGGAGGKAYRVYVDSLPIEAQIRYWQESALAEIGAGCREFDLAGYRERKGEAGLAELLRRQRAAMAAHGLRMHCDEKYGGRGYMDDLAPLAEQLGVPVMTLYRWERAYAAQGLAGIARKDRRDAGRSRSMCLLARDYVEFLMYDQRKPPQSQVMANVRARADEAGADACESCPYRRASAARNELIAQRGDELPLCDQAGEGMIPPDSRHAVNRAVALISKSALAYARYGSRYWDANWMQKVKRDKPDNPNAVWFGDHHKLDLFVLDRDGRAVRPWFTAWMDAQSSAFVGWMLTLEPNSDTVAESFARAAVATVGSPFVGLPQAVYIDNGKDYRSTRFEGGEYREGTLGALNGDFCRQSMLEALHVEVHHAIPYWAWTKPIERAFGTLEDKWMRGFPAWCGDRPDMRPQDLAKDIREGRIMTFEVFAERFKTDVIDAYHNFRGADGKTALERYHSAARARTDDPDWATMCLIKSQRKERVVRTQGVSIDGTLYQDVALGALVGERVTVLYNRGVNPSVSIMHNGRFVCEADQVDTMGMIERDRDKLAVVMAQKTRQRRAATGQIAAIEQQVRGVHREAYAEEIDDRRDRALAKVSNLEGRKVRQGKADADKRRRARKGEMDEGARRVDDMMLRRGEAAIRRAQEG